MAIVRAGSDAEASNLFDKFVSDWLAAGGRTATEEMSSYLKSVYK